MDTACRHCGAPMISTWNEKNPNAPTHTTTEGFRCKTCSHWNNLSRRGKKRGKDSDVVRRLSV